MRTAIAAAVVALSLAAAGCGKDVSIAELKKIKDEACACHDATCAKAIGKKFDAAVGDATEDDMGKEGMALGLDIAVCLGKAEAGF